MKFKKTLCILCVIVAIFSIATMVSASVANPSTTKFINKNKQFTPDNGSLSLHYTAPGVQVRANFQYGDTDTQYINAKSSDTDPMYTGLDIKSVNQGSGDGTKMDAQLIYTNMPNPKTDLETNWLVGFPNINEAEVVALGTIVANTTYYLETYYEDSRSGNVADAGQWQVSSELSSPALFGEYNVKEHEQTLYVPYGKNPGQP